MISTKSDRIETAPKSASTLLRGLTISLDLTKERLMPNYTRHTSQNLKSVHKQCEFCGETFVQCRSTKRFCNERCQQAAVSKRRRESRRDTTKPFICEECGSEFVRTKKNGRFPRFCGMRCRMDRDIRLRHEGLVALNRKCAQCGVRFVPGRTDQRFCTEKCGATSRERRKGRKPIAAPEVRLAMNLKENESTGCWEWQRSTSSGYGYIRIDNRNISTHRYLWTLVYGDIPKGLQLDHVCRNRSCCNPAHLDPVTQGENLRRGRISEAEHWAFAKQPTMTLGDLVALLTGHRGHLDQEDA